MIRIDDDEISRNLLKQMMVATDPQIKEMYKSLLTDHLTKIPSSSKKSPNKGYVPPASLFSVEDLTQQFRKEDFGEDLPQTLPGIHQAIKELRNTIKENRRLCIENHKELSIRLMNTQEASSSQNSDISGKAENWTFHANPIMS